MSILTLDILHAPDGIERERRSVAGGTLSIGRAVTNDWVLPDPDRFLSKQHMVLTQQQGEWRLTDTSRNGTFLNGERDPVSVQQPRILRNGDRLRVGGYEIGVAIATDPAPKQEADSWRPADAETLQPSTLVPMPGGEAWIADAQSDHAPFHATHFRPPGPAAALLPEDWDLEPSASLPSPPPVPQSPPAPTDPPVGVLKVDALETALDLLFDGANLPSPLVKDRPAALRAIGRVLAVTVSGLRRLVIARAAIKGEFRIEQTTIRAQGNNPLKFAASDEDALASLMGAARRGDMPGDAALQELLQDIHIHEIAMTSAVQAAMRDIIAHFDPARLMRDRAPSLLDRLPFVGQARLWRRFTARYRKAVETLDDDFDTLVGKAFARAYERTASEMETSRP